MDLKESSKNLIVIDTDCGIDDAMAILLALSDKEHTEVAAITCCAGNTTLDNVCNNVMRILVVCKKKKIPVYRGSAGPLVFPCKVGTVHGGDGLGNVSEEFPLEDMELQKIPAANALVNLAKTHPKRITLIAIGPLTNVALAHRLDPDFTSNLKELVLLGGNHQGVGNTSSAAEFNFHFDPEAAHVVMEDSLCPVTMVPWETVLDHGMERERFTQFMQEFVHQKTAKSRFLERILAFMTVTLEKNLGKKFYDCDLLAVAAVICPESVLSSIQFPVTVECSGNYTRGQVVVERRSQKEKKVKIITKFSDGIINKLRLNMIQD